VLPRPLTAGLVGASYVALAAVVAYTRSKGGALASCGCFGTPDTPATFLHLAINLVLALASIVVAIGAPATGWTFSVLAPDPLHGAPLVLAVGVGVWLSYLALSVLSALQAARFPLAPSGKSG
jgi:hypothetical protein